MSSNREVSAEDKESMKSAVASTALNNMNMPNELLAAGSAIVAKYLVVVDEQERNPLAGIGDNPPFITVPRVRVAGSNGNARIYINNNGQQEHFSVERLIEELTACSIRSGDRMTCPEPYLRWK
jgi:hypothetical protein